ncbi:hypothetical protein HDU96_011131 [Phlyctochytrium bullatum]|nr:hypothetical protein HDU96_011131 [Phlyctochytrium bullatum]
MSSLFNFERQFVGYAAYHHNKINQWVHFVCVPIILWTALVWLHNAPSIQVEGWPLEKELPLNIATLLTVIYSGYYIALHPVIGGLMTPIMILLCHTAKLFLDTKMEVNPNVVAAILHTISWIAQFLGHGLAEKRRPALMDNLLHAVVLAPFFVFSEFLFAAGWNPKVAEKLEALTVKKIAEMNAAEKRKAQ